MHTFLNSETRKTTVCYLHCFDNGVGGITPCPLITRYWARISGNKITVNFKFQRKFHACLDTPLQDRPTDRRTDERTTWDDSTATILSTLSSWRRATVTWPHSRHTNRKLLAMRWNAGRGGSARACLFVHLLSFTSVLAALSDNWGAGHFPPGPVNRERFTLGQFPRPDVPPCFSSA